MLIVRPRIDNFRFSRPKLGMCQKTFKNICSTYVYTVLGLRFDCARTVFRLCSTYVSTALDLCFDWLYLCFDCARPMFRLCSTYVSTVLDLCFDLTFSTKFQYSSPFSTKFQYFQKRFEFI